MPAPPILADTCTLHRLANNSPSTFNRPRGQQRMLYFCIRSQLVEKRGPEQVTRTLIENGFVWQEDGFVRDQTLIVVDGVIHSLQADR